MPDDTNDREQFATIQPAELSLGGNGEQSSKLSKINSRSNFLPFVIGTFIVLFGVWVFVFLPDNVTNPTFPTVKTSTVEQNLSPGNQKNTSNKAGDLAPFEVLDAARARKNTEATLAEFVQLQILLEDSMQVKQWAAEKYSSIIAIANQGDVFFLEARYTESMLKYTEGSVALKLLVDSGETQFSDDIKLADQALKNLDPGLAKQAFLKAAVIHPANQNVINGLIRANNMPTVLQYLKNAEKLTSTTQFDKAYKLYKNVQQLDPKMPGVKSSLANLQLRIRERNFKKYLSEAYAALNAGNYQKAENSFSKATNLQPDHASIRDGLRQLESARLLKAIAAIEVKADQLVKQEHWAALPETYATALELDPNLRFAREGIRIAKKRAEIDSILNQIIDNPGKLSSDSIYESALSAYNNANGLEHQGPLLLSQLESIKGILDIAAIPVKFEITSDNLTEVGIVRRGSLGIFSSKTLELRPGSYIFTGSRPGCRDLRKEVQVARGMSSIAVQCEESI